MTAIFGSMCGLRRLTLTRCSGEASTALRVTSEPVPAVVGIAIKGADGLVSAWPRPMTSRLSSNSPVLVSMAAMPWPASNALPPPKLMTRPQFSCFANATPRWTVSISGSPVTGNAKPSTPCWRKSASKGSARRGLAPVITRARGASSRASGPTSRNVPAPKTIRVAVANSKRMGRNKTQCNYRRTQMNKSRLAPQPQGMECGGKRSATPFSEAGPCSDCGVAAAPCHRSPNLCLLCAELHDCSTERGCASAPLPSLVFRENILEFHAGARLGHHGRNRIPPGLVMLCFLVSGGGFGGAIGFYEHEAREIISLLGEIEAGDARLLETLARIGDGGLFEGLHILRLHMNLDMHD